VIDVQSITSISYWHPIPRLDDILDELHVIEEGSGKIQSLEPCVDTLKQGKSQRHLRKLKF